MPDGSKISSLPLFDGKNLTDSIPFSGGTPFNTYRFTVEELTNCGRTGLTGGGLTNLNGVATLNESLNQSWWVSKSSDYNWTYSPYLLTGGSFPQELPISVLPLDHNASSNPKMFYQLGLEVQNLILTGNDNNLGGYIDMPKQAGLNWVAPPASGLRLYAEGWFADSQSHLAWRSTDGYVRKFVATGLARDVAYILPDTPVNSINLVGAFGTTLSGISTVFATTGEDFVARSLTNSTQPTLQFRLNGHSTTTVANGAVGVAGYGVGATLGMSSSISFPLTTLSFTGSTTVSSLGVFRIGSISGGDDTGVFVKSTGVATITDFAMLSIATPVVPVSPLVATNTWSLLTVAGIKAGVKVATPKVYAGTYVIDIGPGTGAGNVTYCNTSSSENGVVSASATTSAAPPYFALIKNNGSTVDTFGRLDKAVVINGDVLGNLYWCGSDGSGDTYVKAGAITVTVAGVVSPGTGIVPSRMDLKTMTTAGALTTAISIDSSQVATFAATPVLSTGRLTGAAGNMTIVAGTGASRTMALQTTTSGGAATTALTLNADQSATFAAGATFVSGITVPSLAVSTLTGVSAITATNYSLTSGGVLTGSTQAYAQASWTATGAYVRWSGGAVTNNSTPSSGTAASAVFYSFAAPSIASLNAITTTDAATVYVAGGPVNAANNTLTNSWGVWNAGASRFDGSVRIGGSLLTTATSGFPYFPTCAGRPSGTPGAIGGAPFVVDSVGNVLYGYVGSQWVPLGSGGNLTTQFGSGNLVGQNILQADEILTCMSGLSVKGSGVFVSGTMLSVPGRSIALGAPLAEMTGGFAAAHINDLNGGGVVLYRASDPVGCILAEVSSTPITSTNQFTVGAWDTTSNTKVRIVAGTGGIVFNRPIALNGAAFSSSTALLTTPGNVSQSSLRIPPGTAPSSPNQGDMWYESGGLKFCDSGGVVRTLNWS